MHDQRLDHYDDKALTERELAQIRSWSERPFVPWWARCIDSEGTLAVRCGHKYKVIGEVKHHIDGRPLQPCDERWIIAESADIPLLEVRKDRLMPETEWLGWRLRTLRQQIERMQNEVMALEAPDARF